MTNSMKPVEINHENQETNAGTQEVQQEQAAQNKRGRNTSKNRPVLVTSSSNDLETKDQSVEVFK